MLGSDGGTFLFLLKHKRWRTRTNEAQYRAKVRKGRLMVFCCCFLTGWEHFIHTQKKNPNNILTNIFRMSLDNQNIIAISNKPESESAWFCFPGFLSSVHSLLGTRSKAALPTFTLLPVAQFATRLCRDYWITNIPTCMHLFFFPQILEPSPPQIKPQFRSQR